MSSNHHTPVSPTALVNQPVTEAPLDELDQSITDLFNGTDAFDALQVGGGGATVVLTEHDSANQDSDVQLQGVSAAGGSIDTNGTGSLRGLGDSGGTEVWRAQSFIAVEGRLSQVQIAFGANNGSPVGDCTLKIMTDNAGNPTGTQLHSQTFTIVPSSNNTINITNGPYLDGASTYWVRLEVPAQATNVGWSVVTATSSTYANGTEKFSTNGGSTWTDDTRDMDVVVVTSAITPNDKLAQGFQVSENATVETVRLWLKKVGSPTGNLTVRIETDSAGDPSGTPVTNGTSDTVAASTLATSYGWITFAFTTDPAISGATQYHIVLETADSQSDTNYVVWGADGSAPSYPDGEMQHERSSIWGAESKDACFDVNGTIGFSDVASIQAISTAQGWLPPRMTTAQRDAFTPADGTVIFNTTSGLLNVYIAGWQELAASASSAALVEIVPLTTVTAQSSVSITIPAGYKDILLVFYAQSNAGGSPFQMFLRFNSDTGSNYRYALDGFDDIVTLATANAASSFLLPIGDDATEMWNYECWLFNYLDTSDFRAVSIDGSRSSDDAATLGSRVLAGFWENAADAIASVNLVEGNSSNWDGAYQVFGLLE